MPCVAIGDETRLGIVDRIENRDEHVVKRVGSQHVVRLCHTHSRTIRLYALRTDNGAADSHIQGSGNALATDVGNHQGDAVIIDAEKVVEVAADILRCLHRCTNV